MDIHLVIQQRRRQLGLTQEQMAEMLGVSTPAVNKWERGVSCPDIALLSPLARLLKIDLNTLLGFHGELSDQELTALCLRMRETASRDGFDAAFALAEETLRLYPSSDRLLQTAAMQAQVLLGSSGLSEEDAQARMGTIEQWYKRLCASEDDSIRHSANFMLASLAIARNDCEKAQAHLDSLPSRSELPDKRPLQASLHLKKKQPQEAAKLMEGALLAALNDIHIILFRLMEAYIALGEDFAADYAAERMRLLAQTFDMGAYSAIIGDFQLAAARKDVPGTIALLRKLLESLREEQQASRSPLYRHLARNPSAASSEKLIQPLLSSMAESEEFAFLRGSNDFAALLADYA